MLLHEIAQIVNNDYTFTTFRGGNKLTDN